MNLSVIICTHNPRKDYLTRVLDALRAQTLPKAEWELLLIDNASKEPLAGQWDLSWHPHARIIREDELGLTPARLRGIKEARSELLVFVDDDNVLAGDYLQCATEIARQWPQLGVFGGCLTAEFEVPPEDWMKTYWPFLAIREVSRDVWTNNFRDSGIHPVGAGMVVRRSVAQAYFLSTTDKPLGRVLGRRGVSLISGEDSDIVRIATEQGQGFGLFKNLKLLHLISAFRLTEDYLVRLMEGIATTGVIFSFLYSGKMPSPSRGIRFVLRHAFNLIFLPRRDRRFYLAQRRGLKKGVEILNGWRGGCDQTGAVS